MLIDMLNTNEIVFRTATNEIKLLNEHNNIHITTYRKTFIRSLRYKGLENNIYFLNN